jgi:branched-subunit amino acid transport protein
MGSLWKTCVLNWSVIVYDFIGSLPSSVSCSTHSFFMTHFNVIFPSTSRFSKSSVLWYFPIEILCALLISLVVQMPHQSHLSWPNHANNIWWRVCIMDGAIALAPRYCLLSTETRVEFPLTPCQIRAERSGPGIRFYPSFFGYIYRTNGLYSMNPRSVIHCVQYRHVVFYNKRVSMMYNT